MFNNLDEKIFLCGNINNGRRLIIRLNKKEPVINYDVLTLNMLSKRLLIELKLKTNKEYRLISTTESAYIFRELILKNDYGFDKEIYQSVGSVKKLLEVLNDYRYCEIKTYNNILKADYKTLLADYHSYLEENSLADNIYVLYLIQSFKINVKCYILDDFKLRPLEKRVLNEVFTSCEIIHPDINKPSYKGFYDCYGAYNEVLNVVKIIEDEKLEISDCEIVYTNDIYENFIKGVLDSRKIKYTINNAHAKSTNLASFILDILEYIKSDFKYELLENILANKGLEDVYLEEFYSTLIKPRIIVGFGYDRTLKLVEDIKDDSRKQNLVLFINDLFSVVDQNKNIDYEAFLKFVKKYVKSAREIQALSSKLDSINNLLKYGDDKLQTIEHEIEALRYSEADINDGISISSLNKSFTNRGNLFIIGLSQVYLTKIDTENPFITDVNGFKQELNDESIHLLEYLKKDVPEALDYYINHSDSNIYLSFASYNKIDFRPSSASVYFLTKLNEAKEENENILKTVNEYQIIKNSTVFITPVFEDVEDVEESFDNGMIYDDPEDMKKHIDAEERVVVKKNVVEENAKFTLSPTAISTLLKCPYEYYYQYIKRVTNVEYPSLSEYGWLDVNQRGTFFHEIMELYANARLKEENFSSKFDEEVFEEIFNNALSNAEKLNVVMNEAIKEMEITELKEAAKNYLIKMIDEEFVNSLYRVLECEYDIKKAGFVYKKNNIEISFTGFVDRLDGYVDGRTLHLRFVDYKTGKYKDKESHGYVQHIIYPYAVCNGNKKQFGFDVDEIVVDSFTYSYPFDENDNVYDVFNKNECEEILSVVDRVVVTYLSNAKDYSQILADRFDETITTITKSDDKNICEYCSYKDICYKRLKEGDVGFCIKKK